MKKLFKLAARCLTIAAAVAVGAAWAQENKLAAGVEGTWKWTFPMPDGSKAEPRVKLKREGDKLIGTSSYRPGTEIAISDGQVKGDEVIFRVVRERDGRPVTTTYQGKMSGDAITGKIESDWSGEKQSYDWVAKRASGDATGTWQWSLAFGDSRAQTTLKLKQDGENLTGKVSGRSSDTEISEGKVRNGEISFQVVRERDGDKTTTKYKGNLSDDTIKGTMEFDFGGEARTRDWEARRTSDSN